MEEKDFYLHPDNWLAFVAFTKVQTQWVLDSKDRKFALDYHRAEVCWHKLGIVVEGQTFFKVQVMESLVRESV